MFNQDSLSCRIRSRRVGPVIIPICDSIQAGQKNKSKGSRQRRYVLQF